MWIYDVNFKWTMKKILERGYIEKIIENLPMDVEVAKGVQRLKKYVEDFVA